MKDQRLGQGRSDKQLDNNARNGGVSCMSAVIVAIIWLIWMLFSCNRSHYSQRFKGHVTEPPTHLMVELPSIKMIKPAGRKVAKEPKERKVIYIMPKYLRETNYHK